MICRRRKSGLVWFVGILCVFLSFYCVKKLHAYYLYMQMRTKLRPGEYYVHLGDFNTKEFLQKNLPDVEGPIKQELEGLVNHGLGRPLPDPRSHLCKTELEHGSWPSTSIIIVYRTESRDTLLRTIYSILLRSPPDCIKEIILIDDNSDDVATGSLLSKIPNVRVERNKQQEVAVSEKKVCSKKRNSLYKDGSYVVLANSIDPDERAPVRDIGLIRSRNTAASIASGDLLTFVSPRCEVNVGWLQPLITRISQLPKAVVVPVLDQIITDTLEYSESSVWQKGGFDWTMRFKWENAGAEINRNDHIVRSPIIPGRVFSIRKDRFLKLGKFDSGLEAQGGENIELSFKNWMCGGVVEIVPCSHVGQIDLATELAGVPGGMENIYLRNIKRIAEVWMDDFKRFFYYTKPSARMIGIGSTMERKSTRKNLKCQTFKWYMNNIYPELKLPVTDEVVYGKIQQNTWCIDIEVGHVPAIAKLSTCQQDKDTQDWSIKKKGEITNGGMCLTGDALETHGYVMVHFCTKDKTQRWKYLNGLIYREGTSLCIDSHKAEVGLVLSDCDELYESQKWTISSRSQMNKELAIEL